ncbi:MAG: fibronectin type III domain-containing protein [Candidatus Falkowbacteria bacterium]|nr:fibronectin type III domain-containing protein [Candidatus Falkowbacteria bacterium]
MRKNKFLKLLTLSFISAVSCLLLFSHNALAATVPDAPTGVSAIAGDAQAAVLFSAPVDDGGSPIIYYTITSSPGNLSTTSTSTVGVINGLVNGVSYTFSVKATNAIGDSLSSTSSVAIIPDVLPIITSNPPVFISSSSVDISATIGSVGTTTLYLHHSFLKNGDLVSAGGTNLIDPQVGKVETSTKSFLSCSTSYSYQFYLRNSAATVYSAWQNFITPACTPTDVSAKAGDGFADVSFHHVAVGGAPLDTSFTVTSNPGNISVTIPNDILVANNLYEGDIYATTTVTVPGLTNGVAYTFTVKATNAGGHSSDLGPSNSITPHVVTFPDAPTNVSAVPGNGSATISFTAPDDGGSPILYYTIFSSPGGFSTTTTDTTGTITGLANGTPYTFEVSATNAIGTSATSSPSAPVTTAVPPDAPTDVVAISGNSRAIVSFLAPLNDGGSPIISYTIVSSPGGFSTTTATTTGIITGLTNGVSYSFSVKATNIIGDSSFSASSFAILSGLPTITTDYAIPVSPGSSRVYGTITDIGGSSIISVGLEYSNGQVGSGSLTSAYASSTGQFSFQPSLFCGYEYDVVLWAKNSFGTTYGNTITYTPPLCAPSAITSAASSVTSNSASLQGSIDTNGGSSVTERGFEYGTSTSYGSTVSEMGSFAEVPYSLGATSLTCNTTYHFRSYAVNSIDTGYGADRSFHTGPCVPDAPLGVSAIPGDGRAIVSFVAPNDGGSLITSYIITSSPGGFSTTTATTTGVVLGLTNQTAYTFTVVAINSVGTSTASAASSPVSPATVPDAPTGVTAIRGNGQATIYFAHPVSDGGSPVIFYTVSSLQGVHSTTGTSSPIILTGLDNGTAYNFIVTATNFIGTSIASAASSPITPATLPDAPTSVLAVASDSSAQISFLPPANDGGSPVTSYLVTSNVGGFSASGSSSPISIYGLTNSVSYTFSVVAINAIGTSTASTSSSPVTPGTIPDAPTGATAVRGNGSATISFTAPVNDGGVPILFYTVSSLQGVHSTTGSSSPIILTGLTNGTAYNFVVKATNSYGDSPDSSASAPVIPATVPDAPTGVSAIRGNGQATISFTASASNGGSAIFYYTITSSPGGFSTTTATTTKVLTGLSNGAPYTFTVTATNVIGTSTASAASSPVTPATVPDAPTGVSAVAGNSQASVSFTPPINDGGDQLISYVITSSPGGFSATTASTTGIVSGLSNGTPYTFTVMAVNSVGTSTASSSSAPITPASPPDAPTSVLAVRGNGQATISFTTPVSDGGSPITSYIITSSPGGFSTTTVATSTTGTISGLSNGTAYTFSVVAVNLIGNSSSSAPSTPITPATIPGTPTSVTAIGGNSQATISFTAPNDGGSPILYYTIYSSMFGDSTTTASTTKIFTGLFNGASYSFTVTATNDVGTSSTSTPSNVVTAATAPDAPTGVTAARGNGQARISFTSPISNGGSAVTSYLITSSPGGFSTSISAATTTGIVSGLTNGTSYTFSVVAINLFGTSTASTSSAPVIPATVPDAPTGVTAITGNGQATISFTAPNDGGSPINAYTITSSPGGFSTVTVGTSVTISGLTNGTPYTFTVIANNAVGDSATSSPSNSITPATVPGAPTGVSAIRGNSQATISFTAPVSNGYSPIISYTITSSPGGFSTTTSASTTSGIITGLTNGTSYTFTVKAHNAMGDSLNSTSSSSITPATIPSAPTAILATRGDGQALVSFAAANDGGSPIISYLITSVSGGFSTTTATTSGIVVGLTNGVSYTFNVVAINSVGTSSLSAASNAVTPATLPGAPSLLSLTPGNSQVTLYFNAPTDDGGSPITSYSVFSSGSLVASGASSPITVTGLTNNVSYSFTVKAVNIVGTSATSSAALSTSPIAPASGGGGGGGGFGPSSPTQPTVQDFWVSINQGASKTLSTQVTLNFTANSSVKKLAISNTPDFLAAAQENFVPVKNWTLTSGFGLKKVYIKFYDSNGVPSGVYSPSIELVESLIVPVQPEKPLAVEKPVIQKPVPAPKFLGIKSSDLLKLKFGNYAFKDSDKDGLGDELELLLGTDPNNPDTDGDWFYDGLEIATNNSPLRAGALNDELRIIARNYPQWIDADRDGLPDYLEKAIGSNPLKADTNGNKKNDSADLKTGFNPALKNQKLSPNAALIKRLANTNLLEVKSGVRLKIDSKGLVSLYY